MKSQIKFLITVAMLATVSALIAQEEMPPFDGPGPDGHRPPPPPIIGKLDTNHDGVIDADEIANASKALQALDINGDGQLTPDELHPHPPRGGGPGMDGPGPDCPPPRE